MSAVVTGSAMRAAIFSDAAPNRNGVGTYYGDLVEHLEGRVADVQMFCPEQARSRWDEPIRLPLPGDATQRITVPNPRDLRRRYEELAPHAVVLATPGPYGLLGLRLARKHKANIVVGFHTHLEKLTDLYWTRKNRVAMGRLFRYYLESCNRAMFRHATTVLANSREMVDLALELDAPNAELMGTTIPRPFIDTPVSPLADELSTVTFAGRLAAEKNLGSIIEAAEALPEITFRIAGDGPERDVVEQASMRLENLEYLGWTSREKVLQVIDASDMLVLPSHVESFGTIALEALTRSRVVLVSQACGITQWPDLSPGLFRIGEGESLAQAVQRVASLDPAVRRQKAQLGRKAAVQLNTWTVDHWIGVLSRPAADRSAHG